MPRGVYKRTQGHAKNLSMALKKTYEQGRKPTKYWLGKKKVFTKKHKENIRKAVIKRWSDPENKAKYIKIMKGRKFTEEHKAQIKKNHADVSGKNNPRYKDGRCVKTKMCLDCGKKIGYRAKRCGSCCKYQHLNYNWNNGNSKLPYSKNWTKKFKEIIRERDNNMCRSCGLENDLLIHHIDTNKLNSDLKNLITLCRSCHHKIHSMLRKAHK